MVNDTTNITGSAPSFFNSGAATVSVNGGAPVTFTDTTEVGVGQSLPPAAGFADATAVREILVDIRSSFLTYALATAIGPITGAAFLANALFAFPTTGGAFILDSVGGTATFTATTATAVPEPASLVLLGTALLGLAGFARRKVSR